MSDYEQARPFVFLSYCLKTAKAVSVWMERMRQRGAKDLIQEKKTQKPTKQITLRRYSKLQNQNPQLRHHLAPGGI